MTKKDYVAIAAILHNYHMPDVRCNQGVVVEEIAQSFCRILQADNPRFDRARFLVACGVQS